MTPHKAANSPRRTRARSQPAALKWAHGKGFTSDRIGWLGRSMGGAMLVMEAAFGIAGLIAAPIYYAYLKQELSSRGLI